MKLLAPKSITNPANYTHKELLAIQEENRQIATLPYFPLCRQIGVHEVDAMIRGRLLELRWSPAITEEGYPARNTAASLQSKAKSVGPTVSATTGVMRYAMGEVLRELDEEEKKV